MSYTRITPSTSDVTALKNSVDTTIPGIKARGGANNTISFAWDYPYVSVYVDSTLVAKLKLGITLNNSN